MKPNHLIIPSTPLARRIGAIFHRRPTTGWNQTEIKSFKTIFQSINFSDLSNIERRYRTEWPPDRTKNSLRHDLEQFLKHYGSECDRANAWCDAHPEKKERKVIQMPPIKGEPFIPTEEEIAEVDRFNAFRKQRKLSPFKLAKKEMGR